MELTILPKSSQKESNAHHITRVLRHNILNLTLYPGQLISENEIKDIFDTSRTPVREAFMTLEKEHLLDIRAQYGTFISLVDLEWIEQLIFMRLAIEKDVVRCACNNISPRQIARLEANIMLQLDDSSHTPSVFIDLDKNFHRIIYESVGKELIWDVMRRHLSYFDRFRYLLYMDDKEPYPTKIQQHRDILDAIKDNDPESAVAHTVAHLGNNFSAYHDQIHHHINFFKNKTPF